VSGGVDTHDRLIRELAYRVSAAVVFVEYDLAPEKWYPVQNEQAYAALGQIVAMAGQLAFDASRIAVVGDDAGATIAIAVTLMTKQRRGPEIGFQLLFCPITGELTEDGSAHEFRDGPWLTRSEMQQRLGAIFPDPAKRAEATALPLRATPQQLNDLPPALVITAEWDIVRDQGEAYVRRLLEAGVDATATRYNGTIHDFVVLNALADSSATRGALAQATAALRNAFYGT
jgi:acetyl esterase